MAAVSALVDNPAPINFPTLFIPNNGVARGGGSSVGGDKRGTTGDDACCEVELSNLGGESLVSSFHGFVPVALLLYNN